MLYTDHEPFTKAFRNLNKQIPNFRSSKGYGMLAAGNLTHINAV